MRRHPGDVTEEAATSEANCVFCRIVEGVEPSWKVLEDERSLAFLDIHPVSEFHTLVIPKAHHADLFGVPERVALDVLHAVKQVLALFESKLGLRDVQVHCNSGAAAQQDVFHVHFHVIPRWPDDGLDVHRATHPEWRSRFDVLLERLR
jgi:histidine triad (HIT) family protein